MTLERDPTLARPIGIDIQPGPLPVLASKLRPPPARDGIVERAALVERLRTTPNARTVLIQAPLGYGKTSLLAQWAAADRRSVAWISLDRHDDDPIVLLTYLAAAIGRIQPIHPAVVRALRSPSASVRTRILPSLAVALSALDQPILLILDDVHELHHPDVVDALGFVAASLPDGSQLALAARGEPSLPIARWRAGGRLLELGPNDLALDAAEAGSLLERAGVALTSDEVRDLADRTEGWPAGLYLAALAIQRRPDEGASRSRLHDRDRFLGDYLRSELAPGLTPREVRFLTRTSVLDRLSAPLCDAVTGRRGSAAMLAGIERANLFLVPLDHERDWYRYHGLFRAMLADELERREPGRRRELQVRAAEWFVEQGRHEEALGYFFEAGELDRAAELVEWLALPLFRAGRMGTLRKWLDRLDAETLGRHPSTAALAGLGFALIGEAADADRWVTLASQVVLAHDEPESVGPSGASAASLTGLVRALTCPDGPDRMLADATSSVAREPDWSPWRTAVLLAQGVGQLLVGDVDQARTTLTTAAGAGEQLGAQPARSAALAQLGLLAVERGEWTTAETFAAKARSVITAAGLADYPMTALAFALSARTVARRGDLARARADLAHLAGLVPHVTYGLPWLAIQVRVEMARTHLLLGDHDVARTLLREIDAILDRRPDVGTLRVRVDGLREHVDRSSRTARSDTLTEAELRLVPLLPTHLSFIEIADIQVLSPNTVKTQAISIYRKLGASSRSDAVARARELGLLDS